MAWVTRRRVIIAALAAAVLAVVIVGALLGRDTGPAAPVASPEGADRVSFRGTNVLTGEELSLAQFDGKPVVVTIWASWCPGCNAEARTLARFAKAHPEAAFVGVDFSDTEGDARAFYEKYGWKFPSVFDPDGEVAGELGLQGTPTTIFLDSQHREVSRVVGETDEAGFAAGLEQAAAAT
jgi:thiol-disulfide isomerase/thioredoxin